MEDLNKKLAEWAGLNTTHKFDPIGVGNLKICRHCGSISPPIIKYCNVPNFTQSLDACFKWLVPKLSQAQYYEVLRSIFVKTETTALNLCLAIEKLIDGELK